MSKLHPLNVQCTKPYAQLPLLKGACLPDLNHVPEPSQMFQMVGQLMLVFLPRKALFPSDMKYSVI